MTREDIIENAAQQAAGKIYEFLHHCLPNTTQDDLIRETENVIHKMRKHGASNLLSSSHAPSYKRPNQGLNPATFAPLPASVTGYAPENEQQLTPADLVPQSPYDIAPLPAGFVGVPQATN